MTEITDSESGPILGDLLVLAEVKIKLTGDLAGMFGFESDDLIIIYGAITTPERYSRFSDREVPSKIVRSLKKWCKEESLIDAVKLLRKAIRALET